MSTHATDRHVPWLRSVESGDAHNGGDRVHCLHCDNTMPTNDVLFGSGNRYRLRRLLKVGGMAYVFAAVDTSLSRYVALKSPILPSDQFDATRARAICLRTVL